MNLVLQSAVTGPARSRQLRIRPLLAALLNAGILLSTTTATVAIAADAAEAVRSQPAKTYAIGAAPLADVLNRFAAESGVVLVFDAGLLGGAQSKGLQGKYDVPGGFQALLGGTRYDAVMNKSGGFVLRERAAAAAAARGDRTAQAEPEAAPTLQPIHVQASTLGTVEKLDRQMIENTVAVNGDLTTMLRINPNIQYDDSQLSSMTGGEISPAEISIHGAKAYQNEILLDGVSIANDIDPGNKITTSSPDMIPGSAQSLAVDASILCEIEVLDSNVSAEYGRFVGGVVKSRICAARKQFGGKVSVGYTSSSWSKLLVDPAREQAFEDSTSADLQPNFKKWTYKTTAEARLGADWGVLVSGVRRTSEIPLNRFTTTNAGTTESREVTQKRKQDTLIVKTDYSPATGIHKGEMTLAYAPSANSYFIENFRNSDYTIESGGLNLSGRLESRYDLATVTNQLSYSRNKQSRRGAADTYLSWRWSTEKNWGDPTNGTNPMSGEGAQGDVDQEIKSVEYKLRAAFTPFKTGPIAHRASGGLELRNQEATYERLKNQYNYSTLTDLPTTGIISRCQAPDGTVDTVACSATPTLKGLGQFFRTEITYNAGAIGVKAHSTAAYLEDEATWGEVSLRAGVRADRDSLISKTNVAPRVKLGWQASDVLALDVGANRYYGRNLFAFAMQEKVNTLKTQRSRTTASVVWAAPTVTKPSNRLEDLNSPYDDELTAGLTYDADVLAGPLSVRYTHRDGKDQVVRVSKTGQTECANSSCFVFTNSGKTTTKDVTVSWSNARAFKFANTANRLWVAVNKSKTQANYSTYAASYSPSMQADSLVRYDGTVMRFSEIPAANYNRPWTARFGAMTTLPSQHLTINNMLRVRGNFEQVLQRGTVVVDGTSMTNFEPTAMPRSVALDTVIHWSPRIYKRQELDVKLTIENITNHKNMIAVNDSYATYERGRTIALEIGYDF